jgi:hypothetical protein
VLSPSSVLTDGLSLVDRLHPPVCQGVRMARGYGETVVLRTSTMRVVGAGTMAVVVVALAVSVPHPGTLGRWAAPLLLVGLLGWAGFWRPCVEVSDGGVRMVNVLRTVEIPWPAIEDVDGRFGLQLRTAYGSFNAWGAGAPSGRQRARAHDSEASALVRERWEALKAEGWLDDPRLERPHELVGWHAPVIAAGMLLALVTLLVALIG